jgi:hypothetical protein
MTLLRTIIALQVTEAQPVCSKKVIPIVQSHSGEALAHVRKSGNRLFDKNFCKRKE